MNYKLQCIDNNGKKNINIRILQQKKLFPLIIHSMLIQIKTFTIIKKFKEKKLKTIEAIIDKYNYNVSFKLRFFPYSIRISIILVIVINEPRTNCFVAFLFYPKIYRREYIFEKFNIWKFKFNRIVIRKRNWKRNLS